MDAARPPATLPAANETVGRFVWHDPLTPDAAACTTFYSALLGWKFESTTRNGRPYFGARSGGQPAGGIVERKGMENRPAAWLAYLSVTDLEGTLDQVKSAGGKVLLPATSVSAYGRIAVVLDPRGAPLGLAGVTAKFPDPGAQAPSNRFFWMEYLAKDGPAALAFYQVLGAYDSSVQDSGSGNEYYVLKRERLRAGLMQIPAALEGVEPNWLPYVRLNDPVAIAAKARALGGHVVLGPCADVHNGTLAIIADPSGGALALQKWPL